MNLTINGEPHQSAAPDVAALLDTLGLAGRRVAVEINRRIVPRATYAEHALHDGDVVEIVHFVGGG